MRCHIEQSFSVLVILYHAVQILSRIFKKLPSNSQELWSTVSDIEAASRDAGARLIQAEADHQRAMRAAVATNSPEAYAGLAPSEAELNNARAAADRINAALSAARAMYAEALAAERAAAQETTRKDVARQLTDAQAAAAEIDAAFASLCEKLLQLREMEIQARSTVRATFGAAPPGGPRALSAADYFASHLRSLANGLCPAPQAWTTEALRGSAFVIREGCVSA